MKSAFSTKWKASKQPRKQRKYAANAPLHTKGKMMGARLSKELTTKHSRRTLEVKTGDKVTIMRGQFRKKSGKVERVNRKESKVYITGIETIKKDGSKSMYPTHPSNLMITELNTDDKKRIKAKATGTSKAPAVEKKAEPKTEEKKQATPKEKAEGEKKNG